MKNRPCANRNGFRYTPEGYQFKKAPGASSYLKRWPKKYANRGMYTRGHPGSITKHLEKVEDRLGIPRFPLHKLRHYFASQMSAMGVPEADILKMGGWETDHVMKSVYRHSMMEKEEKARRDAAEKLRNALFN